MTEEVRDDIRRLKESIPTWVVVTITFILGLSAIFAILLRRTRTVVTFWYWLVLIVLSTFVLYLFYRLVLAVEKIAEETNRD